MELKEAIQQAQELARKNHEDAMIKIHCFNANLPPRKWKRYKQSDGAVIFGLEGTPDKAFVKVSADKKSVLAIASSLEVLKEFQVE